MSTPVPAPERAVAPDGAAVSFADLDVPDRVVASLAARGITHPFPIQVATLPDALGGRDVCGRAPTGSGKTIAFGIPLVLAAGSARPGRPRGLVLVPTRELAAQVATELELLAGRRGPRVQTFYGGVGFGSQLGALRRGVDIAVACPGRLADLVGQGAVDLGDVEVAVIDEADRMADMGFLPEVRRLLDRCPEDRQTLLFSATLDGDVDVLTSRYQRDPARHEPPHTEDHDRADHRWWQVERAERVATTAALVDRIGPTIVFCRTRHGADRVARQLETAGVAAAAIHGGRSQAQRDRALQAFHRGDVSALVATDVAARGIHVTGVTCVVHFDPPADEKDYVHRSGRTARAGTSGVVVTLVGREVRKDVTSLQKTLGHPVGTEPADLDALELSTPAPTRRPRPAQRSRPGHTAKPGQSARPGQSAKPGRSAKRGHTAKPGQSARPGQSAMPGRTAKPGTKAKARRRGGPKRSGGVSGGRPRAGGGARPSR